MAGGPGGGGDTEPLSTAELAIRLGLAVVLLFLAQTFTGLNLGLFSLDCGQLQVIIDVPKKYGETAKNRANARDARRVLPLRRLGNLLLCTILLGNTMVNAAMAILLAGVTSGIIGWLITTVLIVYVGEILPQSICAKHGLKFGALGSPIIWVFVILLFPVTKLYAFVLDRLFPDEESLMDRSGWRSMLEYFQHVNPDGMHVDHSSMLLSSLDLGITRVRDVMVPVKDACYVYTDDVLNLEKLMWVQKTRRTRFPVYDRARNRFVGLLHCKDLLRRDHGFDFHRGSTATVATLLRALERIGQGREICQIAESRSLLDLISLFKEGKSHLVVVIACNSNRSLSKASKDSSKRDPSKASTASSSSIASIHPAPEEEEPETASPHVGVVTLHDVYHSILKSQKDQAPLQTWKFAHTWQGASDLFIEPILPCENEKPLPDDELRAIKVLLEQTQPCFNTAHISENELWNLLKETGISFSPNGEQLYRNNERSQIAMIILRGEVEISAGKDGFTSRVGNLAALGMQALEPPVSRVEALRTSGNIELLQHHDVHEYIPDFNATVVSKECVVLRISRQKYLQAYGSTQVEKARAEAKPTMKAALSSSGSQEGKKEVIPCSTMGSLRS